MKQISTSIILLSLLLTQCFFFLAGQGAVAPQADVHILGLDFPRNSESSMEKGQYSIKELRVDSFDEKVVAPIPTRAYTPAGPRVPKHKATAIARGLTVTPPPL